MAVKLAMIGLLGWLLMISSAEGADDPYVLYTQELPPYSMIINGQVSGLSVDIVSRLFARAGVPYRFEVMPWQRAYLSVRNQARACLFPLQRSQEREAVFHWVSPILISQTGFYTLTDSPHRIRSLADASSLKIGSYRGSIVAEYLGRLGYELDLSASEGVNLDRLRYRRVDVWAVDTLTAAYLARLAGGYDLRQQLVYYTTLRSLACNLAMPDNLVERLQIVLREMHRDGTIENLTDNYR